MVQFAQGFSDLLHMTIRGLQFQECSVGLYNHNLSYNSFHVINASCVSFIAEVTGCSYIKVSITQCRFTAQFVCIKLKAT